MSKTRENYKQQNADGSVVTPAWSANYLHTTY